MADLSRASVEAWLDMLPDDARSAIPDADVDEAACAAATAAVASVRDSRDVVAAVDGAQDSFVAAGRAARLRFLAWFAARPYSEPRDLAALVEGGEGTGDGDGPLGKVAPLFASDLRALVEALGPRAARLAVDGHTLAAVTGAGFEVASEMAMGKGGGL